MNECKLSPVKNKACRHKVKEGRSWICKLCDTAISKLKKCPIAKMMTRTEL